MEHKEAKLSGKSTSKQLESGSEFGQEGLLTGTAEGGPESAGLMQLQAAADASPQVQEFRALQQMVTESPMQQEAQQRKETLEQNGHVPRSNAGGLPEDLLLGIEQLSGMDMGDVRVHRNSSKAREAGALAYAQGNEIHLGPGQEHHLPHEAWHVVQQRQGRVQPTTEAPNGAPVNDDEALEKEATEMGEKALRMKAGDARANQSLQQKSLSGGVAQRMLAVQIELEDFEAKEKKELEESKKKGLEKESSEEKKIDLIGNNVSGNSSIILVNSEKLNDMKDEDSDEKSEISEKKGSKYVIAKLGIIGRPEGSHGGTMGDHTTAHGVFQKGLIAQLQGRPLEDAFKVLGDFYKLLKTLPGYAMKGSVPKKQKELITNAENAVDTFLQLDARKLTPLQQCNQVQIAIQNVLQVRELLTYSTINVKRIDPKLAGKGKGESAPLKVLTDALTTTATDKALIQAAVDLFDIKSVLLLGNHVKSNRDEVSSTYLPGASSLIDIDKHIQEIVKSHLIGLEMSFPTLFDANKICPDVEKELMNLINPKTQKNVSKKRSLSGKTKTDDQKSDQKQQGFAVQISVGNDGKILETAFSGRTESPFSGSMGAHSSAWVMHQDIVANIIKGKDLDGAIKEIKMKCDQLVDLFESRKADFFGYPDHHKAIKWHWGVLGNLYGTLPTDEALKLTFLQKFIDNYLATLNVMPGSTIESSDTKGNAEGIYRPQLLTLKRKAWMKKENAFKYYDCDENQLKKAMLKLVDLKLEDDSSEKGNNILLKQHFEFIKEAYPTAYEMVFKKGEPDLPKLNKEYLLTKADNDEEEWEEVEEVEQVLEKLDVGSDPVQERPKRNRKEIVRYEDEQQQKPLKVETEEMNDDNDLEDFSDIELKKF